MLNVTTSWDDGDVLDERLVSLLEKYGMRGTFYIPRDYWGKRLADDAIRNLAARHEIGAHTLTHADLSAISLEKAKEEIEGSKQLLAGVCGKSIDMFCYPRGRYNNDVSNIVKAAGFKGARTTRQFSLSMPKDLFQIDTTIQVYPFPIRHGAGFLRMFRPLSERFGGFRSLGASLLDCRSWESVTKAVFDEAVTKGDIFHLWGHSWEIEKYGMWASLERVFGYISKRSDCRYVTNGELV